VQGLRVRGELQDVEGELALYSNKTRKQKSASFSLLALYEIIIACYSVNIELSKKEITMIFTKDIEKISFADVVAFCEQRSRENINLDYKKEIDASLTKTIAAMANTWGGMIIIGVEDEDSMSKLPVEGISYEEHLRERINNLGSSDILVGNRVKI